MNCEVEKRPPIPGKEDEGGNKDNCKKNKIYNFNPKCFENKKLEDILSNFDSKKDKNEENNFSKKLSNKNNKIITKNNLNNKPFSTAVNSFQHSILKPSNNPQLPNIENGNTSTTFTKPLISFEKLIECNDGIIIFRDFLESKDANFAKALDFYFAVKGFKILLNDSTKNENVCSFEKLMILVRLIYKRYITGTSKKLLDQQVRRSVTDNVKLLKKHIFEANNLQNNSFICMKDLSDKLNLPFSLGNIFDEALLKTEQFLKTDLYFLFLNSEKHYKTNYEHSKKIFENNNINDNTGSHVVRKKNIICHFICQDPSKVKSQQNAGSDDERDIGEETSGKPGIPIKSKEPSFSFDKKPTDSKDSADASNTTKSEALRNNSLQNTIQTFYPAAPTFVSDSLVCNQQTPAKHQNPPKKLQEVSSHNNSQPPSDHQSYESSNILKDPINSGRSFKKETLGKPLNTCKEESLFHGKPSSLPPTQHLQPSSLPPTQHLQPSSLPPTQHSQPSENPSLHNNSLITLNNQQQSAKPSSSLLLHRPSHPHSLSFLPNSALDSEFESISSDPFTDDVLSNLDPSRLPGRHVQKDFKSYRSKLLHGPPFIPRTHKTPSNNSLATKNPPEFARLLNSKLVLLQFKQQNLEVVFRSLLGENNSLEGSAHLDNKFSSNTDSNGASDDENIHSHNNDAFNSFYSNGDQINKGNSHLKYISESLTGHSNPVKRLFDINNNHHNLPSSTFQSKTSIHHKRPTDISTSNHFTCGMHLKHLNTHPCLDEAPQSILDKHISAMWDSFGNSPSLSPIFFSPLSPSFSSDALPTLPTSFHIDPQKSRLDKGFQKSEKLLRLVDGLEDAPVNKNYEENYLQKSSYNFSKELNVLRPVEGVASEVFFKEGPTSQNIFSKNSLYTPNKQNKSNNVLATCSTTSAKNFPKAPLEFLSPRICTANDKNHVSTSVSLNIPSSKHSRPYIIANINDKKPVHMSETVVKDFCDRTPGEHHHTSATNINVKPHRNSQSAITFYNNGHNSYNITNTLCLSSTTDSNVISKAYHISSLKCLCALKLKPNITTHHINGGNKNKRVINAKVHSNTNFKRNNAFHQSFTTTTDATVKSINSNKLCSNNNSRANYSNKRCKSGQHNSVSDGAALKSALDLSVLKVNEKVLSWMENSEEFNVLPTKECSYCCNNKNNKNNNNNNINNDKVHNTNNDAKKSGFKYIRNLAHSLKSTSIMHN